MAKNSSGREAKRKKIFLVNRDFQLRYARIAIFVGILTSLLTAFVVLYPLYIFEILRIPRFLPWPILLAMSTIVMINIGALAFVVVLVTHRIAGPMYSLFREIRRVAGGHYRVDFKSRPSDEFAYVLRNFNEMAEELCATARLDQILVEELIQKIDKNDFDRDDVLSHLNELKQRLLERQQAEPC